MATHSRPEVRAETTRSQLQATRHKQRAAAQDLRRPTDRHYEPNCTVRLLADLERHKAFNILFPPSSFGSSTDLFAKQLTLHVAQNFLQPYRYVTRGAITYSLITTGSRVQYIP